PHPTPDADQRRTDPPPVSPTLGPPTPVPAPASPTLRPPAPVSGTAPPPPSAEARWADGSRVSGRGPAPLPVRGSREGRANPAEALPGIRPGDRAAVEENAGLAPVPRTGAVVRGTMGKPRLPRRRAQEHIAPQLRGGPVPRPDVEHQPVGHDPGLMAAFQRGIGLAEAQQSLEAEVLESSSAPYPEWEALEHSSYPVSAPLDPAAAPPFPTPRIPEAPADPQAYGGPPPGTDHSTPRHDGSAPAG
ncbi:ATP-binding protein, partial [Streptomyces vulcanius]